VEEREYTGEILRRKLTYEKSIFQKHKAIMLTTIMQQPVNYEKEPVEEIRL